MNILSKEALTSGVAGQSVEGIVLMKQYAKRLTKTGKDYVEGQLMNAVSVAFKAWSESNALRKLLSEEYSNVPVLIKGTWNEYQGSLSIVLDDIFAIEGYSPIDFMESPYNTEAYANAVKTLCKKNLSESGMKIANLLLFENESVWKRFCEEFAAKGHHDNVKGGLLAHTYKLLFFMSNVLATYQTLLFDGEGTDEKSRANRKDLIYLGTLIHDIGKIDEMQYGVYQPNSAISHRILGLDYLFEHKNEIIETYDIKWYRDLQSILVEHHNEWADPCRTVVSYVVNLVDVLDAKFTGLCQNIEQKLIEDTSGSKVFMDDMPLAL